jgi:uncharacterized protein YjlB
MAEPSPLAFRFDFDGDVPNSLLPALVYADALDLSASKDPEGDVEALFKQNGWGRDMWRDGVYPYVHYHPRIHEALGVARGSAILRIGGDRGETLNVQAGDVLVLPAGTGHQRLSASKDFCVIGAYPPEGEYSLCRVGDQDAYTRGLQTAPNVAVPESDPVHGVNGPLPQLWRR